jgi:hypothetical protein
LPPSQQLGRGPPIPDERGHVRILLEESEGAAWQRVSDALDAAGDDWDEHLHLNPRPGSFSSLAASAAR